MDSTNPDPANIPDDDLHLQGYQDDLDTSGHIHDPIMDEENDDPTEELGIPPKEFKEYLDHFGFKDNDPFDESGDHDEEMEDYYSDQEED